MSRPNWETITRREGDVRFGSLADSVIVPRCPLYPRKRTLVEPIGMSALCQQQTFADAANRRLVIGCWIRKAIFRTIGNDFQVDCSSTDSRNVWDGQKNRVPVTARLKSSSRS